MFQSPKSGKFESNQGFISKFKDELFSTFQSPKSGEFESNYTTILRDLFKLKGFQSPKSGKFESNDENKNWDERDFEEVSIP